jgi:putative hydrolase of HD superfamily
MALVLMEHVRPDTEINELHVLKMLLVHDIIEIDAGDTFCYDASANATKAQRETAAADRIFSLLPPDQAGALRRLWDEFEAGTTPEAKLAQGLDRLQPILQNLHTGGASWRRHHVTKAQVLQRNNKIGETMPEIWAHLVRQLDQAAAQGFFRSTPAI